MNRHNSVFFLMSILIVPASSVLTWAQEPQFLDAYEFNQDTLAGNGWEEIPGGFETREPGVIQFVALPNQALPSSADVRGIAITVKPKQVTFLYALNPLAANGRPILLRMTARASSPWASIALVALRGNLSTWKDVDGSIGLHHPASAESFVDKERRIVLVYEPDKGDVFTVAIQVAGNGAQADEDATVWIDKVEMLSLDPYEFGADSGAEVPTPTPTYTLTPTTTPTPIPTATPTPTPIVPPNITALKITNVSWNYSSPFLLDFNFSLRDQDDHALIAEPSLFKIECMENGNPISQSETAFLLAGASNKQLLCSLVLDYTLSMANIENNGDADSDYISDAVETMEEATKFFVDSLNVDAQVGIYEFHSDANPGRVTEFSSDKNYLRNRLNAIWNEYIKWNSGNSRCWDAVYNAIQEFSSGSPRDEQRFIVFLSDGRDESSIRNPSDVIGAANAKGIKVYCIGFGAELDESALRQITEQTNGEYYTAETVEQMREKFQQIISDLGGQYTLRWATLKRDSSEFTPSFILSLNEFSDSYTSSNKYRPTNYAGDVNQGKLRLVGTKIIDGKATVFLRAEYVPRRIRKLRLQPGTEKPFTVSLIPGNNGGLCGDWKLTQTVDANGKKWIEWEIQNPNPFASIPYGAFGPIMQFEFTDVSALNEVISCGWIVDNSIYADSAGQSFELFSENSVKPIPTCTFTPTPTPTPTKTYTPTSMPTPTLTFTQTPTFSQTPTFTPASTPTIRPGEIIIPLELPVGAIPLYMELISAGTFMMGSPDNEQDRGNYEDQHQVTITKPFYMGKYEITQPQWQAVMGSNPSSFKGNHLPINLPVEQVSWNDCQTFIQKLNQLEQGTFCLPTQAEWEYACRAGTQTRFYWGDDPDYIQIKDYAWYKGNNSPGGTKEVGLKLPNAFGLYDMSGNVWEWILDGGGVNVVRGGSWNYNARDCRSASLLMFPIILSPSLGAKDSNFGFRVVRSYP